MAIFASFARYIFRTFTSKAAFIIQEYVLWNAVSVALLMIAARYVMLCYDVIWRVMTSVTSYGVVPTVAS